MESFYKTLPFYNLETENFTYYDDDIEVVLDEENQFLRYYYCYDDYYSYETGPSEAGEPVGTPWLYVKNVLYTQDLGDCDTWHRITGDEVGFVAYLYNEDTRMLEPMSKPPFNGWEAKDAFRFLNLPRMAAEASRWPPIVISPIKRKSVTTQSYPNSSGTA